MKNLPKILMSIFVIAVLTAVFACKKSETISSAEKEKVKAAMMEYVGAKLASDQHVYKIEDLEGVFDYIHEGVKFQDGQYVSCADVNVGADNYDIDYYVKKEDGRFSVVKEVLHKKNGEKVNKLLWKKN
jgi:uncharacterized protein YcgL (UPF0745 family)